MIPKRIHSCWFGGGQKSPLIQRCQNTWKEVLVDYEFLEWNEETYPIDQAPQYVRDCYVRKQWAFVSDYVRAWALNQFGGIYMDTDVEILKNFDPLLSLTCFLGFADQKNIGTAVMGSEVGHWFFREFLAQYETISQGTGNNKIATDILFSHGLQTSWDIHNTYDVDTVTLFPKAYFEPIDYTDRKSTPQENKKQYVTQESFTIHYSELSWVTLRMWVLHYIGRTLEWLGIRKIIKTLLIRIGILDPKIYGHD